MNQHILLNPVQNKKLLIKSKLKKIGIAEVSIAAICIAMDIIITIINHSKGSYYYDIEYISVYLHQWSKLLTSIWTLVTGILAIAAGLQNTGDKIVVVHMIFAILGSTSEFYFAVYALLSTIQVSGLSVLWAAINGSFFIFGLTNFSLLVASSVFAGKLSPNCCKTEPPAQQQVIYIPQNVGQATQGVTIVDKS